MKYPISTDNEAIGTSLAANGRASTYEGLSNGYVHNDVRNHFIEDEGSDIPKRKKKKKKVKQVEPSTYKDGEKVIFLNDDTTPRAR